MLESSAVVVTSVDTLSEAALAQVIDLKTECGPVAAGPGTEADQKTL